MENLKISNFNEDYKKLSEDFKKNGYLFLKNFFSYEKVYKISLYVMKELAKAKWSKSLEDLSPTNKINNIGSDDFFTLISTLMKVKKIHYLAKDKKLNKFISKVFNINSFLHPRKMIRITYPYIINSKDLIPPHQDIFYVRGEIDTFTVWIPLINCSQHNGALKVAEGSHIKGLFPVAAGEDGSFKCTAADTSLNNLTWKTANYEIGDILIMHSLTLHASSKNKSGKFRISLDCRFSDAKGYINEEQLLPPYFPNILDWKYLLNTKYDGVKFFNIPSTLKIDSKDLPIEQIIKRYSRWYLST